MGTERKGISGSSLVLLIGLSIVAIAGGAWWVTRSNRVAESEFAEAMTSGKAHYDNGSFTKALDAFQRGLALNPNHPDVHLNLANSQLRLNQPLLALQHADQVLNFEPGSGAAHYIAGCSHLRMGNLTNAIQSLQQAKDIDRRVNAVSYQLGLAYSRSGKFQLALEQFEEVTQFETNHLSAYYQLSQMQRRLGLAEEAERSLAAHQQIIAGKTVAADNPGLFEKCEHTEIRAAFAMEQPDETGIEVRYVDATSAAFGDRVSKLSGPVVVIDLARRGTNDLFLRDNDSPGLRLFRNIGGTFQPQETVFPVAADEKFHSAFAAELNTISDLQPERQEDLVVAGSSGIRLFRVMTNGTVTEMTRFSGIAGLAVADVVPGDLDFTGKLGLMGVLPDGRLKVFRSLGNMVFRDITATSGIPVTATGISRILIDDLNNDDLPDVLLVRKAKRPMLVLNQRGGGGWKEVEPQSEWPESVTSVVSGDFNNDLREDLAFLTPDSVSLYFAGLKEPLRLPAKRHQLQSLETVDFDNDGWVDLAGHGVEGIRLWRNRGRLGFTEVTEKVGLAGLRGQAVDHVAWADFDSDCDTDAVISLVAGGIRLLRNDGGNTHGQLRLRFLGTRSNPSGLGVKAEVFSGGFHVIRTAKRIPLEIGLGKRRKVDVVNVRWFDTQQPILFEGDMDCRVTDIIELTTPTGSCPYLYAWDGKGQRFVTDMLGASPLGLPAMRGRLIEPDPEEILWIGTEEQFPPRDGAFELRMTEELREVLYLDSAELMVVDRPLDSEVHPTSKLVHGPPFPKHEIWQLSQRIPLRTATDLTGQDRTETLADVDGKRVSPPLLRGPSLRGLAEPHGIILEFDPLSSAGRTVMVLNGWLRFGGGMANVGASDFEGLPFPFPVLSAEIAPGTWRRVDVTMGAPAGKTKSIVVDLSGKLPEGVRRLKIEAGFEIHWDRIALFGAAEVVNPRHKALPAMANLRWRGYSEFEPLPSTSPLTPDYSRVRQRPDWRITPSGWGTRYGEVKELLERRDDGVAVVAAGDELMLRFPADGIPAKRPGTVREFFVRVVGWDKDADFHVTRGWELDPLPWNGMNGGEYGVEKRPSLPSDSLHAKYNQRWIGPMTWDRKPAKADKHANQK